MTVSAAVSRRNALESLKAACRAALNAAHEAVEAVQNDTGTMEQLRDANDAYRKSFEAVCNFQFGAECGE